MSEDRSVEGLENLPTSSVFDASGEVLIVGDMEGNVTFWKLDKNSEKLGRVRIGGAG